MSHLNRPHSSWLFMTMQCGETTRRSLFNCALYSHFLPLHCTCRPKIIFLHLCIRNLKISECETAAATQLHSSAVPNVAAVYTEVTLGVNGLFSAHQVSCCVSETVTFGVYF